MAWFFILEKFFKIFLDGFQQKTNINIQKIFSNVFLFFIFQNQNKANVKCYEAGLLMIRKIYLMAFLWKIWTKV